MWNSHRGIDPTPLCLLQLRSSPFAVLDQQLDVAPFLCPHVAIQRAQTRASTGICRRMAWLVGTRSPEACPSVAFGICIGWKIVRRRPRFALPIPTWWLVRVHHLPAVCFCNTLARYNSNTAVFRTSLTDKRPGRLFQATIERGNVMKGYWEFESAATASKPAAAKSPFWISRAPADSSTPREVEVPVPAAAASAAVAAGSLSGSDRLKNYELLEPLGNGVFGVVSKVRRLADNKILVWKELNYGRMNTNERRMMMNEVQILSNTSHAHIVKYFDTILVREKQKMYIVIECATLPNFTSAS